MSEEKYTYDGEQKHNALFVGLRERIQNMRGTAEGQSLQAALCDLAKQLLEVNGVASGCKLLREFKQKHLRQWMDQEWFKLLVDFITDNILEKRIPPLFEKPIAPAQTSNADARDRDDDKFKAAEKNPQEDDIKLSLKLLKHPGEIPPKFIVVRTHLCCEPFNYDPVFLGDVHLFWRYCRSLEDVILADVADSSKQVGAPPPLSYLGKLEAPSHYFVLLEGKSDAGEPFWMRLDKYNDCGIVLEWKIMTSDTHSRQLPYMPLATTSSLPGYLYAYRETPVSAEAQAARDQEHIIIPEALVDPLRDGYADFIQVIRSWAIPNDVQRTTHHILSELRTHEPERHSSFNLALNQCLEFARRVLFASQTRLDSEEFIQQWTEVFDLCENQQHLKDLDLLTEEQMIDLLRRMKQRAEAPAGPQQQIQASEDWDAVFTQTAGAAALGLAAMVEILKINEFDINLKMLALIAEIGLTLLQSARALHAEGIHLAQLSPEKQIEKLVTLPSYEKLAARLNPFGLGLLQVIQSQPLEAARNFCQIQFVFGCPEIMMLLSSLVPTSKVQATPEVTSVVAKHVAFVLLLPCTREVMLSVVLKYFPQLPTAVTEKLPSLLSMSD